MLTIWSLGEHISNSVFSAESPPNVQWILGIGVHIQSGADVHDGCDGDIDGDSFDGHVDCAIDGDSDGTECTWSSRLALSMLMWKL